MCTLIVLDRVVPGLPMVAASNRDEFYSRPAAPPARVEPQEEQDPAFVAPQDLDAGGTWMGLNARGLFVGLTNRRAVAPRTDRRSRGHLVLEALRRPTARVVAEDMRQGLEETYNPFHLFYADGRQSFLTCLSEEGAETRELGPGTHVICSRDPADPGSGKVRHIQNAVARIDLGGAFDRIFEGLVEVLTEHGEGEDPLEHVCVHTPGYGTRSSAILALGEERWRYWHAEGAPCQAKFRDYTRLLDELRERPAFEERTWTCEENR
jgi:uncharacterized protein with NRDE domain